MPPAAADATAAEATAALAAAVAAAAAVATLAAAAAVPAAAAEAADGGAGTGTEKECVSTKEVAPEPNTGGRDRVGRSAETGAAAVAVAVSAAAVAAAAAAGDDPTLNRPVVAENGAGLTNPGDGVGLNENAGTEAERGEGTGTCIGAFGVDIIGDAAAAFGGGELRLGLPA